MCNRQQALIAGLFWCLSNTLPGADAELGERLYRQGIGVDGKPVKAIVQGDIEVDASLLSCASCHRNSGYGDAEGGEYVPPITAEVLFNDYTPERSHLFRNLYQDIQTAVTRASVHDIKQRRAYDRLSLKRALTEGIGSDGRTLSLQMPRFQLSDADIDALQSYLETLGKPEQGALAALGIDAETIHFATVFIPNEGLNDNTDYASKKQAIELVFSAYLKRKNLNTHAAQKKPDYSLGYKSDFVYTQKLWQLHKWELQGPATTWREQLDDHYAKQPVFAVLGGLGNDWHVVHQFCETRQLPCLFPNTALPVTSENGNYALYLSRGLSGEAQTAAEWLNTNDQIRHVVQLYRENSIGEHAARFLEAGLSSGDFNIKLIRVPDGVAANQEFLSSRLADKKQQAIIAWLNREDINQLPFYKHSILLGSASMAELWSHHQHQELSEPVKQISWIWPWAMPQQEPRRLYRVRAWMRSRWIPVVHEVEQFNTFFALDITDHAMYDILDRYSRDYFIELIERMTENSLNPGLYSAMSLGPGQRFAATHNRVIRLDNKTD